MKIGYERSPRSTVSVRIDGHRELNSAGQGDESLGIYTLRVAGSARRRPGSHSRPRGPAAFGHDHVVGGG